MSLTPPAPPARHAPPDQGDPAGSGRSVHDDDLDKLVRNTSIVRQCFYVVVLLVALAGQVSGAVEVFAVPWFVALPAVGALELGGIVVLANADVRRRLGERAVASRLLSVGIAAGAAGFNWLAHADHLLGGFFAGMSALGYLVWLMHTENQRRDRLRILGDLPPTTPAYELLGHWLTHPLLTVRAKSLAKADPRLGLYDSLTVARTDIRREHRHAAISKVLYRKLKAAVDPATADIAVAVYDLDEIAVRLAAQADYDGLTALLAADLDPARLAPKPPADTAISPAIKAAKSQASTATGPAINPAINPAVKATAKAAPKAAKVAAIVASRPGIATGEAAKLAGASPRTARRVINTPPALAPGTP